MKMFLVIDDQPVFRDLCSKSLKANHPECAIAQTGSVSETKELLSTDGKYIIPQLSCVLLDGLDNKTGEYFFPVIGMLRNAGYEGPIITMSSDSGIRRQMLELGCTHEVKSKAAVADLTKEIF
jgi:CheY-like chemotaxis protein